MGLHVAGRGSLATIPSAQWRCRDVTRGQAGFDRLPGMPASFGVCPHTGMAPVRSACPRARWRHLACLLARPGPLPLAALDPILGRLPLTFGVAVLPCAHRSVPGPPSDPNRCVPQHAAPPLVACGWMALALAWADCRPISLAVDPCHVAHLGSPCCGGANPRAWPAGAPARSGAPGS